MALRLNVTETETLWFGFTLADVTPAIENWCGMCVRFLTSMTTLPRLTVAGENVTSRLGQMVAWISLPRFTDGKAGEADASTSATATRPVVRYFKDRPPLAKSPRSSSIAQPGGGLGCGYSPMRLRRQTMKPSGTSARSAV